MSLNANEEMLADNADATASHPDADPDATYNLNTVYADTEADLYDRIISFCCTFF